MTHPRNLDFSDRIQTIQDERERIIVLSNFNLELPSVDIFDEPTRCYKVNEEWAKIITGAIDLLCEVAVWKDAQHEGYIGIRKILEFLKGSACMDCDGVENCLTTSEIISFIDSSLLDLDDTVAAHEYQIIDNQDDISDIQDNPADGNTYEPPTPEDQSDELCQITGHLASKIGDYIAQIDTYSDEPTLLDALNSAMNGDGYYAVTELIEALNNFFVGGADPLFSDYQSQQSDVHEWLYCENNLSKDELAIFAVENLTRGQEISDMLNSIALSTWEQWQVLGQHATGYDCSSFACGEWCYRFDASTGWSPFTIAYGTSSGRGIDNAHWNVGSNQFSGWQVNLNPNDISGLVNFRVKCHYLEEGIVNSTILYMLNHAGSGTGNHVEVVGGGWSGVPTSRDVTIDVSDWEDLRFYGTTAAKSGGAPPTEGDGYIEFIELSGTGSNPFGEDNCS